MTGVHPYRVVPRTTWLAMQRLGHDRDVAGGGIYDARIGAVNVWCSPDDRPESWSAVEITRGAFPEPRGYMGCVMVDQYQGEGNREVRLVLDCTPFDRWDRDKRVWEGLKYISTYQDQSVHDDEMEWLRSKIDALYEEVANE